ncbi:hypothetical protein DVJ77_00325 [Dyella tabacisoli]|uniref:Uncharacterized protein n=2 Tax=Dyella tabacisoli TaxID=2282381 RepID=A0A369UQR1_9GAMM|nr:hypothetical protein DVJ77_00325 [Dyella tabacisoli]
MPIRGITADTTYASIDAFLRSLPNASLEKQARGDLNGDGRADWVGSIRRQHTGEKGNDETRQIYVLMQMPSGTYTVAAQSHEAIIASGTANNDFDEITLSGSSFYLSQSSAWHECVNTTTTQVQWRHGMLRLIGVDYQSSLSSQDGSPTPLKTFHLSRNTLTGVTIEEIIANGKPAETIKSKTVMKPTYLQDYPDGDFNLRAEDFKHDPCR